MLRIFILKSLISRIENLITRIPLIRPIYSSAKVLVDWMNEPNPTTAEKTVVLIEFPRKGCYNIAFLLQSARNNFETLLPESERQHDYYKVFMPNSPNPSSGFFLIVRRDEIIDTDISFEDAIKTIVSCGIYTPTALGGNQGTSDEQEQSAVLD